MIDSFKKKITSVFKRGGSILPFASGQSFPWESLATYESYMRAGTQRLWALWKACDLIGKAVASTPLTVTMAGSSKPVNDPALSRLLDAPNSEDTRQEFLTRVSFHLLLTGNAYAFKGGLNLLGTKPEMLLPLNPKRVLVIPGKNGGIAGYRYHANGGHVDIAREEMIHFRLANINNDYLGQGPVEAAGPMIENAINRQNYERGFWKNGAKPSGAMINEEFDGDQAEWEKMKRDFHAKYEGSENAGKTIWLNGKWKFQQFGPSAADAQDIEKSKLSVEQLFMLMGVPLSVAGIRDAANYATAELDDQRFKEYTILPLVNLIVETLQSELIVGFNPAYRLRAKVAGLIPVGKVISQFAQLVQAGGLTPNELRQLAGLDRADNPLLDQYYQTAALVPIDLTRGIHAEGAAALAFENAVRESMAPRSPTEA